MKIAICDDNQEDSCNLERLATNYYKSKEACPPDMCIFQSEGLISYLENFPCDFDLFILNITPDTSGIISIAKKINKISPNSLIIYTGDCPEITEQLYETAHIYFIAKKNIRQFLPKALCKAEQILMERNKNTLLCLRGGGVIYQLAARSIKFFEVTGHTICVHTTRQQYQTNCPLSSLADMLPANFARTHNSFILNFEYIHAIYADHIQLTDENIIPVSRTYKKSFLDAYSTYLSHLV